MNGYRWSDLASSTSEHSWALSHNCSLGKKKVFLQILYPWKMPLWSLIRTEHHLLLIQQPQQLNGLSWVWSKQVRVLKSLITKIPSSTQPLSYLSDLEKHLSYKKLMELRLCCSHYWEKIWSNKVLDRSYKWEKRPSIIIQTSSFIFAQETHLLRFHLMHKL